MTHALHAGFLDDPIVRLLPGTWRSRPYVLEQPLLYCSVKATRIIEVPKGYRSDLLSVPWIFRRLVNRGGPGRRAAIIHDYLCDTRPRWSTGTLAAEIFREAMIVDKVSRPLRTLMYWAVLSGGPRWP